MLPFAGIATLARAPHRPLDDDWRADTAFLGLPFDIAVGFRPGARFAPRAIREASLRYALPPEGFYDLRTGRQRLAGASLVDAGDVNLPSLEPEVARDRMTAGAAALRQRARLPVFLGGDHSITYPVLRAYADEGELHVVQVDAHLDFTEERNSTRFSNSSPFRRASEELPGLRQVTTLGLRGMRFDREAVESAHARGHTLVPAWEMGDSEHLARLPEGKRVYLSLDLDALDPAVFPATSSPEPDGLTFGQVLAIVRETAQRNTVIGLDLVEMTPHLDPSGNSALLAARLTMEAVAAILDP